MNQIQSSRVRYGFRPFLLVLLLSVTLLDTNSIYLSVTSAQASATIESNAVDEIETSSRLTVGTDSEICAANSQLTVPINTNVYFCYTITNEGTETLYWHTLSDNRFGIVIENYNYELAPNASLSIMSAPRTISVALFNNAKWQSAEVVGGAIVETSASAIVNVSGNPATDTPTAIPTPTPLPTSTPEPTDTPTPLPTFTSEPTDTPTSILTFTPEPTDTPTSILTFTPEPTDTPTSILTFTPRPTSPPFSTFTPVPTDASTPISTLTSVSTSASTPVQTPTSISTATATITATLSTPSTTPLPPTLEATATSEMPIPEPQEYATVNIAHFASFANNLSETSVTIRFNGADSTVDFTIVDLTFNTVINNLPIIAGEYVVEVLPSDTDVIALTGMITVNAGLNYTMALTGNGSIQPLDIYLETENNEVSDYRKARLNITHLAPFEAALSDTAVDVCIADVIVFYQDLLYGSVTEPMILFDPGIYDIKIAKAGTNCAETVLALQQVELTTDKITRLFIIGDGQNIPFDSMDASTLATIVLPTPGETVTPTPIPPSGAQVYDLYLAVVTNNSGNSVTEPPSGPPSVESDGITTESGLKVIEILAGNGDYPQAGRLVQVHYIGWLEDGTEVRNSYTSGGPVIFELGMGALIEGWEEGLLLIRSGGKTRLIIPPALAYGDRDDISDIPPGSTLTYDIEVLGVTER